MQEPQASYYNGSHYIRIIHIGPVYSCSSPRSLPQSYEAANHAQCGHLDVISHGP
jgi:hypothetical protein